jgi:hypothetical protein
MPAEVLKKKEVNEAVFESDEGKRRLRQFEDKYGVEISNVGLEDVDYDKRTQKARDLITNARSFDEALTVLMKQPGQTLAEATRIAKLSFFPNVTERNFNVTAPDLQNLTHVSVLGGLGGDDHGKKHGSKKGGHA